MTPAEFRAARKTLGLLQREMGAALGGRSDRQVRNWEAGRCPIPGYAIELIRRLLAEYALRQLFL